MNRDDEVQAGENRREACNEDAEGRRNDPCRGKLRAQGRVQRPTGIDAAGGQRVEREQPSDDVDVPAQQVQLRKGEIFGADLKRHEKVSEHGGDGGYQEEEHHDDPVHGEELVVGVVAHQIAGGRREIEANEDREGAADEEEERHRRQIQQGNALMVARQQPRLDAVAIVQVVVRGK